MNACVSVSCVSSKLAGVFFWVVYPYRIFLATYVCVCMCVELIDRLGDQ